MYKKVLWFLGGALLGAVLMFFLPKVFVLNEVNRFDGVLGGQQSVFANHASTTVYTVGYLTAVTIPTSTSRTWLKLQNKGATSVYLRYNGAAATVATGDILPPATSSQPLVFNASNLYTGAISMIADGANTTTVAVTEFYGE